MSNLARILRRCTPPAGALLAAAGPACYGTGLWAASAVGHVPLVGTIAAVTTSAGAVLTVFAVPWLLGAIALGRLARRRSTAGAWSLAVNSIALILLCLVLRNTVGIDRVSFLVAWLAWTGVLCWASGPAAKTAHRIAWMGRRVAWKAWSVNISIGLAAAVAGIALFGREQFLQCFNGDGTEAYELARSLRYHLLPYWEIEPVERFGTPIVYPALICSYWNFALQLLLAQSEVATRLSYWVWWLGVFAVALHMTGDRDAPPDRSRNWRAALTLALAGLLWCLWYTFYGGHYPYMADLACPGIPDALFTLLLLLALDCLRQEDLTGWAVMMTLASLVIYAGVVMLVLTAMAALLWRPVPRGRMLRAALGGMGLLSAVACFYLAWGWREGSLAAWRATLQEEYFADFFAPAGPSGSRLWFACYFLLGCGVTAAIGLVLPFLRRAQADPGNREIAWERTVATVTLLYLLIVLRSEARNLHYLGPLLPIPVVLWLRSGQKATHRFQLSAAWAVPSSAAVGLLACIYLCWPVSRPVFTLNRQLGALTTFQTDSYPQACRWSKLIHPLYQRGLISWMVGPQTWLGYSELAARPASRRPLLVTRGPPPSADYRPLFFEPSRNVTLYCRDARWADWLKEQRPVAGPDRCGWILQAAAISPEKQPRQENVAEKADQP